MEWRKEHRILRISTAYKGRKKQDLATHTTAIGTGTPLRRHLLCTVFSPRFSAWKRELWSGPFLEGSISLHSRPRGGVSALGPQSQPRTTPEAKLPSPESLALIPHPHGLLPRATFLGPDTLNKHILLKALAIYHRLQPKPLCGNFQPKRLNQRGRSLQNHFQLMKWHWALLHVSPPALTLGKVRGDSSGLRFGNMNILPVNSRKITQPSSVKYWRSSSREIGKTRAPFGKKKKKEIMI